jgi:hypothetical protein
MRWICLGLVALLAACSAPVPNASPERVRAAEYVHDGPPEIALLTMVNNRSGEGAHSALLINGSQRVIFDPAGTVQHELLIERDDVLFGMTPKMVDFYVRAHSRITHHVVVQKIPVTPEVAEQALQLALNNGPVPSAFCANSTSKLLAQLPGFDTISTTMFPRSLMEQFGTLPNVTASTVRETDSADKRAAEQAFQG